METGRGWRQGGQGDKEERTGDDGGEGGRRGGQPADLAVDNPAATSLPTDARKTSSMIAFVNAFILSQKRIS